MAINSGCSEVDNGIIITVPAGLAWTGSVQLSSHSSPSHVDSWIEVIGGGVGGAPPPNTKIIATSLSNQVPCVNVINPLVYLEAGDAPLSLRLRFNGADHCSGIANGYEGGVPA